MVKQLLIPLAGVAIFIVLVGILTQRSGNLNFGNILSTPAPTTSPASSPSQAKALTIGDKTIQVEIANTKDLREKGLSGRSSLPNNSGMLFVFDSKQVTPIFWMKGMLISLDMIWISGNAIVKIDKNIPVPPPNTPDTSLTEYSPNQPVDYVLEVNSGFSDQNNIKIGDNVVLPTL
jgi:uncharacterized protein